MSGMGIVTPGAGLVKMAMFQARSRVFCCGSRLGVTAAGRAVTGAAPAEDAEPTAGAAGSAPRIENMPLRKE